jgi:hypothetical protein
MIEGGQWDIFFLKVSLIYYGPCVSQDPRSYYLKIKLILSLFLSQNVVLAGWNFPNDYSCNIVSLFHAII